MYETEVNGRAESLDQIPVSIRQRFDELGGRVTTRSVLPWGEHCTECVWPTCYTTCDLYSPRTDGKCRRFVDGMVRLEAPETANGYLLKISFKQWGKLWTPGNAGLMPAADARTLEQRDRRVGQTLYQIGIPARVKRFAIWRRYDYKKKRAQSGRAAAAAPQCFVVECYNPNAGPIALSLTMRPDDPANPLPFQTLLTAAPGYSRFAVPMAAIERVLDVHAPFSIELIPNNVPDGTTLYFGMLDFATGTGLLPAVAGPVEAPAANGSAANGSAANGSATNGSATNGAKPPKIKTYKCMSGISTTPCGTGSSSRMVRRAALKPGITKSSSNSTSAASCTRWRARTTQPEALKVLEQFGIRRLLPVSRDFMGAEERGDQAHRPQLNIGMTPCCSSMTRTLNLSRSAPVPRDPDTQCRGYQSISRAPRRLSSGDRGSQRAQEVVPDESVRQKVAQPFGDDYLAFLRDCHLERISGR